jgi:hypothetical protein
MGGLLCTFPVSQRHRPFLADVECQVKQLADGRTVSVWLATGMSAWGTGSEYRLPVSARQSSGEPRSDVCGGQHELVVFLVYRLHLGRF